MVVLDNRKIDKAFNDLLSRQDYLVTQGNELARALGNLTAFQNKVLDFCFSFVQADDIRDHIYKTRLIDVIHHLGLSASGASYKRVIAAFKALNERTSLYLAAKMSDGTDGILMTMLFDRIKIGKDGSAEFRFSRDVEPYVFQLRKNFFSFSLAELSAVRSKYTLILMKLWNANGYGNWKPKNHQLPDAVLDGSLEEWESWFIGTDKDGNPKKWTAGRFKQNVLQVAIKELNRIYPNVQYSLKEYKQGRKIIGFRLEIHPIQTHLDLTDHSKEREGINK